MILSKIKESIIPVKGKIIAFAVGALLLIGGAFFLYNGYKSYQRTKTELAISNRNNMAYVSIINKNNNDKRALELNNSILRSLNDSVINELEKTRKSISGAKNKPGDVSVNVDTEINAKDTSIIENKSNFRLDTVVVYNEFTKSIIKIKEDSLFSSIIVNNNIKLYVYSHGEYVNTYKNKFIRFLHLDWRKEDVIRYEIVNSNELIKNSNVRVVKISE